MPRAESRLASLLWWPLNAVQFLYTLTWTAAWITVALATRLVSGSRRAGLALARAVWAPGLVYGSGARFRIVGRERVDLARPHLFVSNHRSWIDIPVLFMALPIGLYFLGKRELARVPFLGWYMEAMGMVFVDRKDNVKAIASIDQATTLLAEGGSVVSFPEGTRSRDGRLRSFKSGGFGAAIRARVDVVPVALVGTGEVLPADGFNARPGTIEVRIGTPIPIDAYGPRDRVRLASAATRAVAELLGQPPPDD